MRSKLFFLGELDQVELLHRERPSSLRILKSPSWLAILAWVFGVAGSGERQEVIYEARR
jgi:hypothetical protein